MTNYTRNTSIHIYTLQTEINKQKKLHARKRCYNENQLFNKYKIKLFEKSLAITISERAFHHSHFRLKIFLSKGQLTVNWLSKKCLIATRKGFEVVCSKKL